MEQKIEEYKNIKEEQRKLRRKKSQIVNEIEKIRKDNPIYILRRISINEPNSDYQKMGLFTSLDKAEECKDSIVDYSGIFKYEVAEYDEFRCLFKHDISHMNK